MAKILYLLLVVVAFTSCGVKAPADFWLSYRADQVLEKDHDQGPWGGHTSIQWRTAYRDSFNAQHILEYAKQNGWILVRSYFIPKDSVSKWQDRGMPIFPLTFTGFNPTFKVYDNTYHLFPRRITSGVRVYKFKTNRVSIQPGTDNSNDENGFVVLNDSLTQLAVYHLWGE